MPLITVTVSTPHKKVLAKADIAAEVSRLSATILHKDPEVTAVIVGRVPPDAWFVGGQSLTDVWLASFWLDIHVTDGSNTKNEKAAFIAAVYKSMEDLLGPLHTESFVRVHDVPADAWGFGGKTQECRYRERQASVCAASAV